MTAYEKGDVVLVPFPFSNQTDLKKRPAVVISANSYNNTSHDAVIMAITSQIAKTIGIGECLITNWQEAGLLKPSVLKTAISTVEQSLILKKLGRLSKRISGFEIAQPECSKIVAEHIEKTDVCGAGSFRVFDNAVQCPIGRLVSFLFILCHNA